MIGAQSKIGKSEEKYIWELLTFGFNILHFKFNIKAGNCIKIGSRNYVEIIIDSTLYIYLYVKDSTVFWVDGTDFNKRLSKTDIETIEQDIKSYFNRSKKINSDEISLSQKLINNEYIKNKLKLYISNQNKAIEQMIFSFFVQQLKEYNYELTDIMVSRKMFADYIELRMVQSLTKKELKLKTEIKGNGIFIPNQEIYICINNKEIMFEISTDEVRCSYNACHQKVCDFIFDCIKKDLINPLKKEIIIGGSNEIIINEINKKALEISENVLNKKKSEKIPEIALIFNNNGNVYKENKNNLRYIYELLESLSLNEDDSLKTLVLENIKKVESILKKQEEYLKKEHSYFLRINQLFVTEIFEKKDTFNNI